MKAAITINIFIPLSIFMFFNGRVSAQATFQKTFGGANVDYAYAVQQTDDAGYIIAGYTTSFGAGSRDVYLIRADVHGNTLWTKTFGGGNTDYAWTVRQTTDGGYIVGGHSGSFGAGSHDVYLIKCDPGGEITWTKAYGGSSGDGVYSLQQTMDGGYIISAHTSSFGAGQHDVYLLKTDADGDTLWTKTYGGSSGDFLRAVQQTTDGGYILVAETFSFGAGAADVYLVRTDSKGDILWAKTYGGSASDYGYSVKQITDGGFIVAGYTSSFGAGMSDVYLLKIDENGNLLWAKTYGGGASDYGYSVQQATDGGYVVAGYTESFGIAGDVYLLRTDSNGGLLWSKTFGGAGRDQGRSVQQTTDAGYIIAGYTESFGAGGQDVYLIKTDALGNSGCHESTAATIAGDAETTVGSTQTSTGAGALVNETMTKTSHAATVDSFLCKNIPTGIDRAEDDRKPSRFVLYQNYPNPFNPSTKISYSLHKPGFVTLKIYDMSGREITTLAGAFQQAGTYSVDFDASRIAGMASGIYFYRLQAGNGALAGGSFLETRKMLLLR